MARHQILVSRFFTIPVHELFGYFIDPRLIERWSAPEGMTLHVPKFDLGAGGKYRYEHTSAQGKYVCDGHFRLIEQNKLLQMVDDEIVDPTGKVIAKNLSCEVAFTGVSTGSGVEVKQFGFETSEMAQECEKGWNQCFDKLQDLVKNSGLRQFHADEDTKQPRSNL